MIGWQTARQKTKLCTRMQHKAVVIKDKRPRDQRSKNQPAAVANELGRAPLSNNARARLLSSHSYWPTVAPRKRRCIPALARAAPAGLFWATSPFAQDRRDSFADLLRRTAASRRYCGPWDQRYVTLVSIPRGEACWSTTRLRHRVVSSAGRDLVAPQ
jgi:hypothetical protein